MFYCRVDDISTSVPWLPPTKERLKKWYLDWMKIPGAKEFNLFLVGNLSEILFGDSKDITWDVDMVMLGESKDLDQLKNILRQGILLGWKNYMMIDMTYNNRLFTQDPHTPITQTRYSRDFYKITDKEIKKFKQTGQKVEVLQNGLETVIYDKAPGYEKWIERIKDKQYRGLEINFKDIFKIPKKVVLLSCAEKKLTSKSKARDLYSASLNFKNILNKVEADSPDYIFIVSAKHGLVELDQELEPYDFTINDLNEKEKKEWAKQITKKLKEFKINLDNDEFFPILIEEYLNPLKPYLKNIFINK